MVKSKEKTLEGPKHRSPPRSRKTAEAQASSNGNEENEGLDLKETRQRGIKFKTRICADPPTPEQHEKGERKDRRKRLPPVILYKRDRDKTLDRELTRKARLERKEFHRHLQAEFKKDLALKEKRP